MKKDNLLAGKIPAPYVPPKESMIKESEIKKMEQIREPLKGQIEVIFFFIRNLLKSLEDELVRDQEMMKIGIKIFKV